MRNQHVISMIVGLTILTYSCSEPQAGIYLGKNSDYAGRVRSIAEITNHISAFESDDFIIANSGIGNDSLNVVIEHGGSGYYDIHLFLVRDLVQSDKYVAYLSMKCIKSDDSQADLLSHMSFSLEKLKHEPVDSAMISFMGSDGNASGVSYICKP